MSDTKQSPISYASALEELCWRCSETISELQGKITALEARNASLAQALKDRWDAYREQADLAESLQKHAKHARTLEAQLLAMTEDRDLTHLQQRSRNEAISVSNFRVRLQDHLRRDGYLGRM